MVDFKWIDESGNEVDALTEDLVCAAGHYIIAAPNEDEELFAVRLIPADHGTPAASQELTDAVREDFMARTLAGFSDRLRDSLFVVAESSSSDAL